MKVSKKKYSGKLKLTVLYGLAALLMATTLYLASANHKRFKADITRQWEEQMFTTLGISSINIENYFVKFSENLQSVVENPLLKQRLLPSPKEIADTGYCCVKNLYDIYKNEVNEIVLLNKQNQVILEYPKSGAVMHNFKRSDFEKPHSASIESGTTLSDVITGKDGKAYLFINCTVFNDTSLIGKLMWVVPLDNFASKYIQPLRAGHEGYLSLLDNHNIIRSHHEKNFVGISMHYIFRDYQITRKIPGYSVKKSTEYFEQTENFFSQIDSNLIGQGHIIDFAHNEYSLAVFRKINLVDKPWVLIMSVPVKEITSPVVRNALITFSLALFVTLILTIISINFYTFYKSGTQLKRETAYMSEIARTAQALEKEKELRLRSQIDVQENERNRISRELHDGLGQYLLAAKIKLEELAAQLPAPLRRFSTEIHNLLLVMVDETKKISNNLMPRILDEINIDMALQQLCGDLEKNAVSRIEYVTHGISENIPDKIKKYLFRIAQEGLANAIKHADASEINIQLLGNPQQITLILTDDGKGFDKNSHPSENGGNGLHNMKDRTRLLGGIFDLKTSPGEGTEIMVKIPLKNSDE